MNEPFEHLLWGIFVFAIVCIAVIKLTQFDTPEEKSWTAFGKNRGVGLAIVAAGAVGVGVVKGCLFGPAWATELFTTLITGFTTAVAAVYINKGYSVGTSEVKPTDKTSPDSTHQQSETVNKHVSESLSIHIETKITADSIKETKSNA